MSATALPDTLGVTERAALGDFVRFARSRFGERIRELLLFGSRARGTGHEDSDVDVLLVVDDLTTDERREVWDLTGDMMTQHDVILGGLTLSTAHWLDLRARERRIVAEIDRDGIRL